MIYRSPPECVVITFYINSKRSASPVEVTITVTDATAEDAAKVAQFTDNPTVSGLTAKFSNIVISRLTLKKKLIYIDVVHYRLRCRSARVIGDVEFCEPLCSCYRFYGLHGCG